MASIWKNLAGTTLTKFFLGIGGPLLKNNAGVVEAKNNADNAYATIAAALMKVYGDDIEINSGAAGSGADWKFTIRRPSTGMTQDVVVKMPADGAPTTGYALVVTGASGGVVTLGYAAIASGTNQVKTYETSLAFGDSSPKAMDTLDGAAALTVVRVIIDTPFNGTAPTLSVGITGQTSKYMPTSAVDLKAAAGTVFEYVTGAAPPGSNESIIATYAPDSSSAGAARISFDSVIPA